MHIGLCYDLRSEYLAAGYDELTIAEFDRDDTIDALESALRAGGHVTERIGNIHRLTTLLAGNRRWDLVFNVAEGLYGFGREAQVPALLEAFGIPYTFSDPLTCALALHKGMCKHVVRDNGIHTANFATIDDVAQLADLNLKYPLFVKPVAEGTGKGINGVSRIDSPAALIEVCANLLNQYRQPVLVEEYLPGREFTVGIVGSGADARAIGSVEIIVDAAHESGIYTYANKELCESRVRYERVGAGAVKRGVEELAVRAWRCLGCRDGGRVDVRMDGAGQPAFLEVNPLAGLHPAHSDLPIICTHEGIAYDTLIAWIVASASRRVGGPAVRIVQAA